MEALSLIHHRSRADRDARVREAARLCAALTAREIEVLQLAADGLTGPEIAARFVVSVSTVKTHFENAYRKLGVTERPAAVAQALRAGVID